MADAETIWQRFIVCKLQPQSLNSGTQSIDNTQSSVLGARSINLSSGSIALHADADTAALMRDLAVRPVAELLSEKASRELASRSRYVDFVRLAFSCCVNDASGRAKKAELAIKSIEAIHAQLVADRPARDLQNILLAELDDITPDRVPLIVEVILAPLLMASRRRGGSIMLGLQPRPPAPEMSEAAAASFLVALDILPKVLGLTADVPALGDDAHVPEGARGLSGAEYKNRIVTRLFRARWPGAVAIGMCQALRDLELGEAQLRVAVHRVLRHLRKNAKLDELPPLTYQLLLLAGRGCKEAALEGVIRVFDRLDAAAADATAEDGDMQIRRGGRLGASSTEHLRLVEGTILLHFNFAMKQDQYLASCLLKGFQRRAITPEIGRVFTPFRVALILSLSRIQRFSQQVLDLVQEIVTACLVYDHSREGSAWLQRKEEVCCGHDGVSRRARVDAGVGGSDGDSGGAGAQSLSAAGVVERVLLTVVRSSRGWDHLVGSLLKLGLQLLDRGGGGVSSSGVVLSTVGATKGLLEKLQASRSQQASLRASHLGRVVLMETFKTHEIVRRDVLTSVLEQVTARSQGVMGYVKLLELLAERYPSLLLDDAEAVRDVFGYISILPPPVAESFLLATAPLLRLRPRLQDSVVLPLRKALFSREERARLVAVGGLVLLLGIQSRCGNSRGGGRGGDGGTQLSQASRSGDSQQAAAMPPPAAAAAGASGSCALSLDEGFGLLRRCLTQQLAVRAKLYDGLLVSFERGSLTFQFDTVRLLVGHFRRFINLSAAVGATNAGSGAGGGAPLELSRCLGPSTSDIVEPLPLLIGCLHRMVVSGRERIAEHLGTTNDSDEIMDDDSESQGAAGAAVTAAAEPLREALDELDGYLRRLSDAVSSAALEEFGLDKVVDVSPLGGPAARAKLATAALLCSSYEAFMQGSLLLIDRPAAGTSGHPASASVRSLIKLFDRRQTLLELVRPNLPTPAQQRVKKASGSGGGSSSSSSSSSLGGDGESLASASIGGSVVGGGGGLPGFSAVGCFGLTLYPGGMPCLGMPFVEDMLMVLNIEREDGEETEGDTERDPGVVDVDAGDPPTQAVREDLSLQQLVLETCRGHLRHLRTSTAASIAGLSVEVGGGASTRGAGFMSSAACCAFPDGPQDEADAVRAAKVAIKRCTVLGPLVLKETFRQLTEGNNSGAAKEAAAAAKANGSKGKGKSGGGDKGKKKSVPSESLSELALACLEECVLIAAYSHPHVRTAASRTAKVLAAAYKDLPDSNVPPADPAAGSMGTSVLGRHAGALVKTLTNLVMDGQTKEAEILCRILAQLTRLLRLEPDCLEAHAASLKVVCKQQRVHSPVLAKALVSLYVQAHMSMRAKGGKIEAVHDLAVQVRACVGLLEEDDDEAEDEPPPLTFQIINNFTITPVSEVTVGAIETCIDDIEYALRVMNKSAVARQARSAAQAPGGVSSASRDIRGAGLSQSSGTVSEDDLSSSADSDRNSDSDSDTAGVRSDGGSGERDPLDRRETLVCNRLQVVMQAMTVLVGSRLEGRCIEKLVSSASRIFRAITKVLKVRLSLKRPYVGLGLKNVLEYKRGFTKALQYLLPQLEDEKGAKVTKNNITRQSRLVPALIFEIEGCDVHLLKLGKLCKSSLDLPKWVTNRVDRDFRIDHSAIATCQEELRGSREKKKRKAKDKKDPASKKKKSGAQQGKGAKGAEDYSEEREDEGEEGGGGAGGDQEEDGEDEEEEGDEDEEEEEESGDEN